MSEPVTSDDPPVDGLAARFDALYAPMTAAQLRTLRDTFAAAHTAGSNQALSVARLAAIDRALLKARA